MYSVSNVPDISWTIAEWVVQADFDLLEVIVGHELTI